MKSGIYDFNGNEVKAGDVLVFPYIDPMGKLHQDHPNFEATVVFEHGAFGFYNPNFTPLFEWCKTEVGEYIPNYGNKETITDVGYFTIKS